MLKPDKAQLTAIKGLAATAPGFFIAYVDYLKLSRDHEREEMENSSSENTEALKGKCRQLTEQINILKSLVPNSGI